MLDSIVIGFAIAVLASFADPDEPRGQAASSSTELEKPETAAAPKSVREWLLLVEKTKRNLTSKTKRADAIRLLATITDPRAVPAVWRAFGTGGPAGQAIAAQVLGQIDSTYASRALAVLAVFGGSPEVRRAATETLTRRDPRAYADLLIGLLREPIEYVMRPVGGPGRPGSLTVSEPQCNYERIYAPPPPPPLPIFPGEAISFDAKGLPVIMRHTDESGLPFAWLEDGYLFPERCVIRPHVPVMVELGKMWLEAQKSARLAQAQLQNDLAILEQRNRFISAANAQIALVLNQATGQNLSSDRATWMSWWSAQVGRGYTRSEPPAALTLSEMVPLMYLPHAVGGMAFDPFVGYYLLVPVKR
jgi:hypothetical protein